jgi:hypothetical protein
MTGRIVAAARYAGMTTQFMDPIRGRTSATPQLAMGVGRPVQAIRQLCRLPLIIS